jgi:hypothetical protein
VRNYRFAVQVVNRGFSYRGSASCQGLSKFNEHNYYSFRFAYISRKSSTSLCRNAKFENREPKFSVMSLPTTATPHPSLDREYVIKSVNKHATQTKLNVLRALKYLVLIERDLNAAGGVLRMLQYRDRNTRFEVTIAEIEAREKQLFSTRARVERGLQHYLDKTLAPECRSLFDKVQSKLPRELRDMLYANIASQMRSCQLQRPPQ